jgi:hypothetical protein
MIDGGVVVRKDDEAAGPRTIRPMNTDDERTATLDAMIAELVESSASLADAARENAEMLAVLLAERGTAAGAPPAEPPEGVVLTPELLELVTIRARAAGMTVDEFLHEAVLAYAPRIDGDGGADRDGDGDLHSRVRQAVRTAQGTRDETRAVRAQSGRATARSAEVQSRAKGRAPDDATDDGGG